MTSILTVLHVSCNTLSVYLSPPIGIPSSRGQLARTQVSNTVCIAQPLLGTRWDMCRRVRVHVFRSRVTERQRGLIIIRLLFASTLSCPCLPPVISREAERLSVCSGHRNQFAKSAVVSTASFAIKLVQSGYHGYTTTNI